MQNMDTRKFIRCLKVNGYEPTRQTGDHVIFHKNGNHISIPVGKKTICGTMVKRLIKENGIMMYD